VSSLISIFKVLLRHDQFEEFARTHFGRTMLLRNSDHCKMWLNQKYFILLKSSSKT